MKLRKAIFITVLSAVVMAISAVFTCPANAQVRFVSDTLINVGNTSVKRILPKPESDSSFIDAHYTDIDFRKNQADLDLGYMNNRKALSQFNDLIDSLGTENIVEIEIIAQASPDGIVSRNIWLAQNRADVILDYLKKNHPSLDAKFTVHTVNESWDNLVQYVIQDPNLTQDEKKRILDIIESPDLTLGAKKAQIKKVGTNPKVGDIYYDYLFKYYYPAIKNTGIYVLHNNATPTIKEPLADSSQELAPISPDFIDKNQQSVAYIRPTNDGQIRIVSDQMINVGNTFVNRILPIPESDSSYIDADYTDIDFRKNHAELDMGYMNNRKALSHFKDLIDSLGAENIVEIEIIAQASPEGIVSRNIWLAQQRADVMLDYLKKNYPSLNAKFTVHTVNESWDNLAQYVIHDPNLTQEEKKKILDIIDSPNLSLGAKKSQIKKVGRNSKVGDIYFDYLFKYYYPAIRNTGIYVLHNYIAPIPDMLPISMLEESNTYTPDIIIDDIEQPEPPEFIHRRPILAVKTNLPYYAFFRKDLGWAPIYNVELELYPTELGRWTFLGEYEFPWHVADDNHECFQILNLQLEARRYFKEASYHSGHYLSAYAGANLFDICFDGYAGAGYQGEGLGAGLGYGYVMPLGNPSSRWKLEFLVKGGFYVTRYDSYTAGNPFYGKYYYDWILSPTQFIRRNYVFRWLGPTGAGITLSYDLIRKKVKDK